MINPNPVPPQRTPYSSLTTSLRPTLPRTLTTPPEEKKRPRWKRVLFLALISLIAAAGTYAFAQYSSLRKNISIADDGETSAILKYNKDSKNIQSSYFKHIGDGRFNVLIAGIGGENHPGGSLTDSLQVISVDTFNKKIVTTSIPRDLYVTIPGYGRAKINNVYQLGEQKGTGEGAALSREVVGNVLGAKISNFVLIDFTGAKDIIDAIGGIDVEVPKAINDPFFPDDATKGYSPFSIKAGLQHMDGKTALRYSRSRETTSDFDRSARQQLIMSAMKKKALSAGVLTNPVKISNLIAALGKHLKTDLQPDEIKDFLSIYKDIPAGNSATYVLDTSSQLGLLTANSDPVAGYIAYPVLGIDKFSEVQRWFHKNAPDPMVAKEAGTLTVVNAGNATTKQLQDVVASLKDYGYTVTLSNTTYKKTITKTQVFAKSLDAKPITGNYLSNQFSTTLQKGSPAASGSDFEILYVPSKK